MRGRSWHLVNRTPPHSLKPYKPRQLPNCRWLLEEGTVHTTGAEVRLALMYGAPTTTQIGKSVASLDQCPPLERRKRGRVPWPHAFGNTPRRDPNRVFRVFTAASHPPWAGPHCSTRWAPVRWVKPRRASTSGPGLALFGRAAGMVHARPEGLAYSKKKNLENIDFAESRRSPLKNTPRMSPFKTTRRTKERL